MEKYSFLNAAHTSYFAEMYDRYLQNPDEIEPSWKAFFQGFDFGVENSNGLNGEKTLQEEVPEHLQKEFKKSQKFKVSNSLKLYYSSFCLPSGPGLSKNSAKKVIKVLNVFKR